MGGDEAETHAAAQQDYRRRGCGLWRCITIYSSNPVVLRASLMQQKHNNAVSAKKQNKKTGLKWNETQKYANISSWIQNIDLIFSFFCFTVRTPFIAAEMEERKRKLRRERGFKGWSHKKKKKLRALTETLQRYYRTLTKTQQCCLHRHDNREPDADGFPRSFIYSSISALLFYTHTHAHTCATKQAHKLIYVFLHPTEQSEDFFLVGYFSQRILSNSRPIAFSLHFQCSFFYFSALSDLRCRESGYLCGD